MAFEKGKVLKAAEKFLSQGKINAAIKEYRQIIENDPDDFTALNMLGDLLARAGEKDEAIFCFSRIADHYREQDFRLKAIAMYRKIEKLIPGDPQTAKTLADLYAAQGLLVDARGQYLVVADAYSRAGQTKQALKVLHKIADLDPHNTDIRLKLADGYLQEGMQPEAARTFSEAANRLLENGAFESALEAYSRALELRPNDRGVLKGLVSAHAALGTAEDAAEILEEVVAANPEETELVSMLADAYVEAEDPVGAERAIQMLMTQDASNYRRNIEVARIYLKAGNEDESARILANIIEPMLAGREENDLLELVNELLARDPEHIPSLRLLARIHWWQRDMEKLRSALERLAESAQASGLPDDERYALTQLVRLAPEESQYLERLNSLGGILEDVPDNASLSNDPLPGELPSYENFEIVDEPVQSSPEAEVWNTGTSDEFEWNSVAEAVPINPDASFADLNEAEENAEAQIVSDPIQAEPIEQSFQEIDFNAAVVQPPAGPAIPTDDSSTTRIRSMMEQELESVDFYITQGYSDIAIDTLELLERQFGSHPEIEARRQQLQSGEVAAVGVSVSENPAEAANEFALETTAQTPVAIAEEHPAPSSAPTTGIDAGLAEIFEEFRVEAESEHGPSGEDFETHYNTATAYKEMALLDEAIREFQAAAGLTSPADGTPRYFQCCNMLGHCFVEKGMPQAAIIWFKKGLEVPGRSSEEYKALQYELGNAYEEMGDLVRAVGVFTEVYGVDVGYRDIAEKLSDLQLRVAAQKKKEKGEVGDW
jgi:tetratricopeptide (TPR) repeat protein